MTESLDVLLERIASSSPTPGGGSVSAFCGAMGVALSRMVANLGIGKQGYEAVQEELRALEGRAATLQGRFLELADEDARAYDGVVAARRMPKGNDEERATRRAAMQAAYRGAAEVPLETAHRCVDALKVARDVAQKGSRHAITDAGVAALLAQAAMRGAALNVRINLAAIADQDWRQAREDEMTALLEEGARLAHTVSDFVESKM